MKYLSLIVSLSFILPPATAAEMTVDEACMKQAVATTRLLKAELFSDMDRDQVDQVIRIASEQCRRQFQSATVAAANNEAEKESSSGDWFTDTILNGETPDKPGNRRLERMRTR